MRKLKVKSKIILIFILVGGIMACSKNNKPETEDAQTEKHTFSLTLENKDDDSEKIEFSGEGIVGEGGGAIYRKREIGDEKIHDVDYIIGEVDKPNSIYGVLKLDDNKMPETTFKKIEDGGGTQLTIRPKGTDDYYHSISGEVKVTNLKYAILMPGDGAASFVLEFEGDFIKNSFFESEAEGVYSGKGKITILENKEMGSYKAP